jgi:hypothetical protein
LSEHELPPDPDLDELPDEIAGAEGPLTLTGTDEHGNVWSGPVERIDLRNFRRRLWKPAITSSGVDKPARIYDLRSTFASNALAAGVTVFELARVMGTSVLMIERHYGALLDGAGAGIAGRLDAHEAAQEEAEQADEADER